jgi:hypothetical protein
MAELISRSETARADEETDIRDFAGIAAAWRGRYGNQSAIPTRLAQRRLPP